MASMNYPECTLKNSLYWDEAECLNYYGMMSLHEMFEIVGAQLTETDIEVLYFLLNETYSAKHPLDPEGWTVKPSEDSPEDPGASPSPQLLKAWRRLKPKESQQPLVDSKPKSGLELLLELERRGHLGDGNLEPLLQLLRVLTRHDLLPLVSHKRRRTGVDFTFTTCLISRCDVHFRITHFLYFFLASPERIGSRYELDSAELISGLHHTCQQTEMPLPSFTQQLNTGNCTIL